MGMTPKGGLPGAARTSPDIEISGAVLMALTMGMRLGENCISPSTNGRGRAPKYPDIPHFPRDQSSVVFGRHAIALQSQHPPLPPLKGGDPPVPPPHW
jgi:hypothetical protein